MLFRSTSATVRAGHFARQTVADVLVGAGAVEVPAPVEELHVADALLDKPAREHAVVGKAGIAGLRAVSLQERRWLLLAGTLAVIQYKQMRGFYLDTEAEYHAIYATELAQHRENADGRLIDALEGPGPVASQVEFPIELVIRSTG